MMNAYRAWLLCVALVLSAAPVQAQQIEGAAGLARAIARGIGRA